MKENNTHNNTQKMQKVTIRNDRLTFSSFKFDQVLARACFKLVTLL